MYILPMPRAPAKNAPRLVNADELSALRASPSRFFVFHEMPYAELPDVHEVVDHAHAVLCSVPLVQMLQPRARKAAATAAVLESGVRHFVAVLDTARDDGFRFDTAFASASGASIFFPYIRVTETAVHPARGDQLRGKRLCLRHSCRRHWKSSFSFIVFSPHCKTGTTQSR
jgi:hypothetical protein